MNKIMSRQNIILFLGAVMITFLISSCIMNEKEEYIYEDLTIRYDIAPVKTEPHTKAVTAFPISSTFGSYAYNIPVGKTYDYNSAEGVVYIDNAEISNVSGQWKCSDQKYNWPSDGSSLTFFAYSPYGLSGLSCTCAGGIRIDDYTVETTIGNAETHADVLVAVIAKDKTSNEGSGVPTIFQHKLARVKVVATLNNELGGGEYAYIKSIRFNNIYTSGDFIGGTWTNHTGRKTYQNPSMTQVDLEYGTSSEVFPKTVMMPQPMTAASNAPSMTIIYKTHNHSSEQTMTIPLYNGPATTAAWEPGKDITYHLYISTKDEYIDFDALPSEWVYEDGNDITLGN